MDQQRVENNDHLNEYLVVNVASENPPVEDQNLLSSNMNNNQNLEPLYVVLRKITNAFKEATIGATTAAHSALLENNLVWRTLAEPIKDHPKSEDMFDKFKYKNEILEKAEGYIVKEALNMSCIKTYKRTIRTPLYISPI
ncbi:21472_t:CDS:2 [Gigaspora margarita]|uniref:21472_t:CDS:1 n=1 Tax=Gigaspora margarita TaxID=4874 RepID=A0ABN7V1J8_GIGMA|nr:21472_t:CDS:2 [Gigaspora margarita]